MVVEANGHVNSLYIKYTVIVTMTVKNNMPQPSEIAALFISAHLHLFTLGSQKGKERSS